MAPINENWHRAHPMPAKATVEDRIAWHVAHIANCGCRPIPRGVKQEIARREGDTASADVETGSG